MKSIKIIFKKKTNHENRAILSPNQELFKKRHPCTKFPSLCFFFAFLAHTHTESWSYDHFTKSTIEM